LDGNPVVHSPSAMSQVVEEKYSCDSSGTVAVTITNLTSGYARQYRLGRWASKEATIVPGKRIPATRKQKARGHEA